MACENQPVGPFRVRLGDGVLEPRNLVLDNHMTAILQAAKENLQIWQVLRLHWQGVRFQGLRKEKENKSASRTAN